MTEKESAARAPFLHNAWIWLCGVAAAAQEEAQGEPTGEQYHGGGGEGGGEGGGGEGGGREGGLCFTCQTEYRRVRAMRVRVRVRGEGFELLRRT